jgi:hypothetical protein
MLDFFLSLRTSLWLLMAQLALFVVGAVMMPAHPAYREMNSMALFDWLRQAPLAATWWLWATVVVLGLLAVNTTACSVEAVLRKRRNRHWLLVVSPQVIHAGFLLMLIAHLFSSTGAAHELAAAREGSVFRFEDGTEMVVRSVNVSMDPRGFPTDWGAEVEYRTDGAVTRVDRLGPNRPSFRGGYGVYLKQVRPYPVRTALLEFSREPGAPWALAGGILFTVGTVALVGVKVRRER